MEDGVIAADYVNHAARNGRNGKLRETNGYAVNGIFLDFFKFVGVTMFLDESSNLRCNICLIALGCINVQITLEECVVIGIGILS